MRRLSVLVLCTLLAIPTSASGSPLAQVAPDPSDTSVTSPQRAAAFPAPRG